MCFGDIVTYGEDKGKHKNNNDIKRIKNESSYHYTRL